MGFLEDGRVKTLTRVQGQRPIRWSPVRDRRCFTVYLFSDAGTTLVAGEDIGVS